MASGILRHLGVLFGVEVDKNAEKDAKATLDGIKEYAKKALGAIALTVSVTKVTAIAEEFGAINRMIKTATDGMGDQDAIQAKILQSANLTKSAYADTAKTVSNLVQENSELFGTLDEAINFNNAATMLFKTAGKTNEEIAGLMEAINKSFAKGAVDSETINQLLEKSPEAVKLLNDRLGSTSDQLAQMVADGKVSLADLKAAFVDNADTIKKSYEESGMEITDAIRNIRNQWGLYVSQVWAGAGIGTRAAKIIVRGFSDFMRLLEKAKPAIIKFLDGAFNWLERIADFISRCGSFLGRLADKVGGVENALKILAVAAGAFLLVMNWSKIISGIQTVIKLASGFGKIFSVAGLKIMAVIAIVALLLLVIEDFVQFLLGNDSVIGTVFDNMGIGADNARQAVFDAFEKVKEFLLDVWDFLKQAAGMWIETVKGFFERHGEQIRANFERAWGIIKMFLEGVWAFLSQLAATLFGDTEDSIDGSTQSTKDKLLSVWQQILDALSAVWDALFEAGSAIFNAIATVIETVFGWIQVFWNNWGSTILAWFKTLWDSLGGILSGFLDIVTGIANFISSVFTGDWAGAWQAIQDIFVGIWNVIVNVITALWETIKMIFSMALSAIQAVWNAVWGTISSVFMTIWNGIVSFLQSIVSGIVSTITSIKDTIVNGFTAAIDWIKGLPGQAIQWGKDFIGGLKDGILSGVQGIVDAVKGIGEKIKSFLHFSRPDTGPLKDYETWMPDFVGGLSKTLRQAKPKLTVAVSDVAAALKVNPTVQTMQKTVGINKAGNTVNQKVEISNTVTTSDRKSGQKASEMMEKSGEDITDAITKGLQFGRA